VSVTRYILTIVCVLFAFYFQLCLQVWGFLAYVVMRVTINFTSEKCREHIFVRRMASSGMLRRVILVRIDVVEELSASFITVTRIGELKQH
jgi:hypothetical protein